MTGKETPASQVHAPDGPQSELPNADRQQLAPKATSAGSARWLFAALAGIFVLQWFAKPQEITRVPGADRGDLVLQKDSLPESLSGWTQQTFQAPADVKKLPEGQYWWVHQWQYAKRGEPASLVSFDQLGLNHWHELTHCYQGLGWTLTERTIHQETQSESNAGWEYVVAKMERPTGEDAILVFSTFYEDGSPAEALRIGIDHDWDAKPDVMTTLIGRLSHQEDASKQHERALQCQVFAILPKDELDTSVASVTELHLATRQCFKACWIEHQHQGKPKSVVDGRR